MPVIEQAEDLMKFQGYLETLRQPSEDTIQEVTDLFMPWRGDITTRNMPGARRKPLFDSYGVTAADRAVNFLIGSLFPSSSDWVALRAKGVVYDNRAKTALDDSSKRIMDALADSNFYPAATSTVRDWMTIGNTTSMPQHDDEAPKSIGTFGGLIFDPIPWSRVWWIFSHVGRPLALSREAEMPAFDAYHFFQKDGDRLPEYIAERYRDKPWETVRILHFVQRNPGGRAGTKNKPWVSHWVCRDGTPALIRRSGFDMMPYVSARMYLMDGDQYGRGLGHIVRPQMKATNEIQRQKYIALGKELLPPFMSEEGSLINFDTTPSGHVVVEPPRGLTPGYLRSGTDFSRVEEIIEKNHRVVSDGFLGDALAEPETQDRSAVASQSRNTRAIIRLAGASQTMDYELLGPWIENTIEIMRKRSALPELDQLVQSNPGIEIIPVFTSPFYTAMRNLSAQRIRAFIEERVQIAASVPPEFSALFLEDIHPDRLRTVMQDLTDVPGRIFRTDEDIEQQRSARAERALMEQLAQLQGGGSRPAERGRPSPPREGSLIGAATGVPAA